MAFVPVEQKVDSCTNYPDFAICCLFIEKFGDHLGLLKLNINNLREGFEDTSDGWCNTIIFYDQCNS